MYGRTCAFTPACVKEEDEERYSREKNTSVDVKVRVSVRGGGGGVGGRQTVAVILPTLAESSCSEHINKAFITL